MPPLTDIVALRFADTLDRKQVNTMNDKVCKNCKWFGPNLILLDGYCSRYPEWVRIVNCSCHYCGEWKDKNDD